MTKRMRAFASVALAVVALLGMSATADAVRANSTYGLIAATALDAVGAAEGQCFPWVKRTVLAATGIQIGFDYRDGYFSAGAVEVSPSEARDGDIIQIVNDQDTSPNAGYSGLHTAIVLDNLGDGRFRAIDSNWQWDGIVRIRPDYAPAVEAARYPGLSVHIYRLPSMSADAPAAETFAAPTESAAATETFAPAAETFAPAAETFAPAAETFAAATEFDAGGQAMAVMLDGSLDDLIRAAKDRGASALWAQDSSGTLRLLLLDGPEFMLAAFGEHFPDPIGPIAVTLVAGGA